MKRSKRAALAAFALAGFWSLGYRPLPRRRGELPATGSPFKT